MIRLRTLGSVDLRASDDTQITTVLRQPKKLALLIYLAANGPVFHRRDRLLALFWGESGEKEARGSLSQAVFQLRAALGKESIVNRGDDDLGIAPALVWCDAAAFDEAMDRGSLAEAMAIYGGELLPSFSLPDAPEFEDWLAGRRTALAARATAACMALSEQAEAAKNSKAAIEWARRAAEIDRFNEAAHRRVITLLDQSGDRAAALRVFEELRAMLRAEFDVDPSAETLNAIGAVRTRIGATDFPEDSADNVRIEIRDIRRADLHRRRTAFAVVSAALIVGAIVWSALTVGKPQPKKLAPEHVAVLYFNDESPRHDLGYLAEGLTSTLIDQLGQVRKLRVISQNGVRGFRGRSVPIDSVARALDAGTIVGGSITRSGELLRITVEMIDGSTGVVVKSRKLERPNGELFALLDDVSKEVSSFLRFTVGQEVRIAEWRKQTRNVDAWRALQQAEFYLAQAAEKDKEGKGSERLVLTLRADSMAQQALELDRKFAPALVVRGQIATKRGWFSLVVDRPPNPGLWFDSATSFASSALRIERSASALELLGNIEFGRAMLTASTAAQADSFFMQSEQHLSQSLRIAPDQPRAQSTLSTVLYSLGKLAPARATAQRALESDAYLEDADQIVIRLFETSFEMGDDEEAGHWCDEIHVRFGTHWPSAWCDLVLLAWAREGNHDPRKAIHLVETFGAGDVAPEREFMRPRIEIMAAAVVARAGMRDSANAMIARAWKSAPNDVELLYLEAAARALLGEKAKASELFDQYLQKNPKATKRMQNGRVYAAIRDQRTRLTDTQSLR